MLILPSFITDKIRNTTNLKSLRVYKEKASNGSELFVVYDKLFDETNIFCKTPIGKVLKSVNWRGEQPATFEEELSPNIRILGRVDGTPCEYTQRTSSLGVMPLYDVIPIETKQKLEKCLKVLRGE